MRIALIGNMNNNNFALMRYFRDLSKDAHLLLYANDGQNSLNHFKPECDTWNIERWKPYIHQTSIPNSPIAAFGFPVSWIFGLRSVLKTFLFNRTFVWSPIGKRHIIVAYDGYDRFIASGISPATLTRVGLNLDVYYPYSTGVEFLGAGEFLLKSKARFGINRLLHRMIQKRQKIGIRKSRYVVSYDAGLTWETLQEIGIQPVFLSVPMVYREPLPRDPPGLILEDAWARIKDSDFTILHSPRLYWRNPGSISDDAWAKETKNNDWLVRSFSHFIAVRKHIRALLLMVEYGQDVSHTKQLVNELGIEKKVLWLPKMPRKELMWLLSQVSVSSGEFPLIPRMIWGGTGWEAFAYGKPLLQGFRFEVGEFEALYGHPPPPMLPANTEEDVFKQLLIVADYPEKAAELGRQAREWFDTHNGVEMAKKWLTLLSNGREAMNAGAPAKLP
jgi:hypothetical protein